MHDVFQHCDETSVRSALFSQVRIVCATILSTHTGHKTKTLETWKTQLLFYRADENKTNHLNLNCPRGAADPELNRVFSA